MYRLNTTAAPPQYHLLVRQQPVQALVTSRSRYRRPVDPAPILQLYDPLGSKGRDTRYQISAYLMVYCKLYHETRNEEIGLDAQGRQPILGSIATSITRAYDVDNNDAAFFPFPEINLRVEGTFRLRFTLMEFSTCGPVIITSTFTSPFTAVDPKCWKGVFQSTPLDMKLASQGIKLKQKNKTDNKRGAAPLLCQIDPPTFATVETPSTFKYPANPGGDYISNQSNSSPSGSGGNYSSEPTVETSPSSGHSRISSGRFTSNPNPGSDTTMLSLVSEKERADVGRFRFQSQKRHANAATSVRTNTHMTVDSNSNPSNDTLVMSEQTRIHRSIPIPNPVMTR